MKKVLITIVAVALCVCCAVACVACTGNALNFGKEYVAVNGQSDILTELNAKTADIGVMDSVMANYYTMVSEYASSLTIIQDLSLADEYYGIAARKGSAFIKAIDNQLIALSKNGKVAEIAAKYNLTNDVSITATEAVEVDTNETDYKYIVNKGTVKVGYTLFAPIAYKDSNNELIGFDIELAKAVFAAMGLNVEFQVIDWNSKEMELNGKTVDVLWNGLTITPERQQSMAISIPYMKNKQVAVIRKADAEKYTKDTATWNDAVMTAESGSAGEDCIKKSK